MCCSTDCAHISGFSFWWAGFNVKPRISAVRLTWMAAGHRFILYYSACFSATLSCWSVVTIYHKIISVSCLVIALIPKRITVGIITLQWPLTSTASEDALWHLRPGGELRPSDRERKRRRHWPLRVCHPYERRAQPGPSAGRRPAHELARGGSLQPAEGAAEPAAAAQRQPRHRIHLLGSKQLHETGRKRSSVQQTEAAEPGAAQTQRLHHLPDQDAEVRRTLQKGNGARQVLLHSVLSLRGLFRSGRTISAVHVKGVRVRVRFGDIIDSELKLCEVVELLPSYCTLVETYSLRPHMLFLYSWWIVMAQ